MHGPLNVKLEARIFPCPRHGRILGGGETFELRLQWCLFLTSERIQRFSFTSQLVYLRATYQGITEYEREWTRGPVWRWRKPGFKDLDT